MTHGGVRPTLCETSANGLLKVQYARQVGPTELVLSWVRLAQIPLEWLRACEQLAPHVGHAAMRQIELEVCVTYAILLQQAFERRTSRAAIRPTQMFTQEVS